MPVYLTCSELSLWLDPSVSFDSIIDNILDTSQPKYAEMEAIEVTKLVNYATNKGLECIEPVKTHLDRMKAKGGTVDSFFKSAPSHPKTDYSGVKK